MANDGPGTQARRVPQHVREAFRNTGLFFLLSVLLGLGNMMVFGLVMLFRWEKHSPRFPTPYHLIHEAFLKDGSLFFFSLTLIGGALYVIFSSSKKNYKWLDFFRPSLIITFAVLALITAVGAALNDEDYIISGDYVPPWFFVFSEIIIPVLAAVCALIVTYLFEYYANKPQVHLQVPEGSGKPARVNAGKTI